MNCDNGIQISMIANIMKMQIQDHFYAKIILAHREVLWFFTLRPSDLITT